MQRSTPAVAVAVVSWNTRELLAGCLKSLAGDVEARRAEVWVVDNGSTDGSARMVAERFPWARLIESSTNLGFGRAVNLVARRTRTPWIAPANADVAVEPGALEALVRAGERHPRAGTIAPCLILPDGSVQRSVQPFPTVRNALLRHLRLEKLDPRFGERLCLNEYWDPARARTVDWATGAFMLVRRSAWDAVGGFDEDQWLYAEDLDLAWRLASAGWTTWYEPSARVRHEHSAAARQAFGDGLSRRITTAVYAWMLRRRGWVTTRSFAAVNLGEAALRWSVLRALAFHDPRRWAGRRDAAASNLRAHRTGLRSRRSLMRFE